MKTSVKDSNTKTLRFSDDTDGKLGKLARKFGRGKQRFFEQMVDYLAQEISQEVSEKKNSPK